VGPRTFLAVLTVGLAACGLALVGERNDATAGDAGPPGDASLGLDGAADGGTDTLGDGGDAVDACDPDADFTSDPTSCGACGHDCLGGACVDGGCQPVILVSGVPGVHGLTVDGTGLYWTSRTARSVSTSLLDGGSVLVLVGDAGVASHVARAGGDVYWTDDVATVGNVYARTLPGGPTRLIAAAQDHPTGITVVGTTVYWALQYVDSMAMSLPDGGATVVTAGGLDFPEGLTHDVSKIYVAAPGGQVFAVGFAGSPKTQLVTGLATEWPAGVAEDGDTLYVTLRNANEVVSMPKDGGALTTLATAQSTPVGIAIDARAIYWANSGNGTIMRLAR
jgi:hypothetical protein